MGFLRNVIEGFRFRVVLCFLRMNRFGKAAFFRTVTFLSFVMSTSATLTSNLTIVNPTLLIVNICFVPSLFYGSAGSNA